MNKQEALTRFDEITDNYSTDEQQEALQWFVSLLIHENDLSDEMCIEWCKAYFPSIVNPIELRNDAQTQLDLIVFLWG